MNLELKHLAPYLPYGLKLWYEHTDKKGQISNVYTIGEGYDNDDIKISIDGGSDEHIWMYKPMLRPMSYLQEFSPAIYEYGWLPHKNVYGMQHLEALILFENHFDVFGLIEKGLAIDINELETKATA